ncbi:hypothetical protein MYAM1_001799 [Malassezia yamatoensis]|uniref:RFX-type winged-helix domain-containing protein n=1 Tax=Malassezia yamatoensis TaxID=253288 RepID=A0AAJ5YR23_9BASI|nr:hypothetical protein MYAM1_001799 [Malassezia yamatoensis]
MKLLYECDPHGEVTQMEFWIAYRDQFTPIAAEGGVALQPAANLIRTVSQTFPGASAMVIPSTAGAQPRFIIRGISQRDRSIPQIQCCWEACPAPDVDSYSTVQEHLQIHTKAAHDRICRWGDCAYELPSTALQQADHLYRHALTHLPSPHTTRDKVFPQNTQDTQEVITFTVERTPSVPNPTPGEAPLPCGAAYLSALVLRYVTRSAYDVLVLTGQGCPAYTYGGSESSVPQHKDREEKFGCPIPRSDQDAMQDIAQQTPTYGPEQIHAANVIMESVSSVEEPLVQSSSRNDILCRLINDTLVTIRPVENS